MLSFDLDMPERTTADYENDVNPTVRAALSAALQEDEQLEVEAQENLPSMGGWTPDAQPRSLTGSMRTVETPLASAKGKARRKKSAATKVWLAMLNLCTRCGSGGMQHTQIWRQCAMTREFWLQ